MQKALIGVILAICLIALFGCTNFDSGAKSQVAMPPTTFTFYDGNIQITDINAALICTPDEDANSQKCKYGGKLNCYNGYCNAYSVNPKDSWILTFDYNGKKQTMPIDANTLLFGSQAKVTILQNGALDLNIIVHAYQPATGGRYQDITSQILLIILEIIILIAIKIGITGVILKSIHKPIKKLTAIFTGIGILAIFISFIVTLGTMYLIHNLFTGITGIIAFTIMLIAIATLIESAIIYKLTKNALTIKQILIISIISNVIISVLLIFFLFFIK